jgi:hypothetical protein
LGWLLEKIAGRLLTAAMVYGQQDVFPGDLAGLGLINDEY